MLQLPEFFLGPLSQLDLATPGPLRATRVVLGDSVRFLLETCGGKIIPICMLYIYI